MFSSVCCINFFKHYNKNMKHIEFFIKYYKFYYDIEIAYAPKWIFDKKRQENLKHNYENIEIFHNDKNKEFNYVCLFDKNNKKYYKKISLMSVKEKRQFIADYLSNK